MNIALYRKYRPQTFQDIVGQDLIKAVLSNAIRLDKVGHAYLFAGPRGTGKTSTARLLAKGINCLDLQDSDACGKCSVCKAIEQGKFIDLIEIDAASNRGIDEIRDLRERVNFAPAEGKRKIYIIDEVHMLTKEAFNALLKTLEEPPDFITFILATTEVHKVPATILSRVQRFDFKLASLKELTWKLSKTAKAEGFDIAKEAAEKIYELSGGSFRDSESLLAKVLSNKAKKDKKIELIDVESSIGMISQSDLTQFTDILIAGETNLALENMENILEKGFALDQLVYQILQLLRKRIKDHYIKGSKADISRLIEVIKEISEVGPKLKQATIPTLALEVAIYNLNKEKNSKTASFTNNVSIHPPTESKKITPVLEEQKKVDLNKSESKIRKENPDIASLWPEVLEKTKKFNHHLYAFLSKSKINKVEGSMINLDVAYKFHKQKIEMPKVREILGKIFEEVTGRKYSITCKVDPSLIGSIEDNDCMDNKKIVEEIFADI